jgi:hypothetical protein
MGLQRGREEKEKRKEKREAFRAKRKNNITCVWRIERGQQCKLLGSKEAANHNSEPLQLECWWCGMLKGRNATVCCNWAQSLKH